jgi:hypothetical protein
MSEIRDEFLSEEDLDLKNLSWQELLRVWQAWLEQAQATNDQDQHLYSHGVFTVEPRSGVSQPHGGARPPGTGRIR